MRVLRNAEDVGGGNLTGKLSLAPVETLWNEWEIHCLVLTSLALQFLLFFTAGMRRRSTSWVLGAVLWLAYLLADSVAVFVLGHLAVRVSGPQHELIAFWAPFLLVHLGGQDTITALSMQDNELWNRHLLGLFSQVAVASYVVSKSSWTDKRLLAATVLVFLSGSFKYAVRTCCLYSARPSKIKVNSVRILSTTLSRLKDAAENAGDASLERTHKDWFLDRWNAKFDLMLGKSDKSILFWEKEIDLDAVSIMSVDAPPNRMESVLVRDDLPRMLVKFQSTSCLHEPYDCVGRSLAKCYENFYTKRPLLHFCQLVSVDLISMDCSHFDIEDFIICPTVVIIWLIVILLQNFPIPIALVLFTLAEKGHQIHNRADVIVSYILLIGAIILDVSSASMSILSSAGSNIFGRRIKTVVLSVANYIQPTWSRRQWSEELAQYSMVKRYATGDARGMSYVWQWIGKRLIACGVELLDPGMTHTQVTEDLKGFVLNKLVQFGIKKQCDFADFRGQLALQEWRQNGPGTETLYYSINEVKDFPTSILIWHIATDICYYSGSSSSANTECDRSKKKKKLSRELSNYILYLVFKCGVMLTSSSQLVHNKVYVEMKKVLRLQQPQMVNPGAEAIMKVFEGIKDKQPPLTVNEEQQQPVDTDDTTSSHLKKLLESMADAIYFPILPHASKVAQELMGINDEGERWDLIAAVWSDMLYYITPRCGSAFHYQHLSTGGEFITHVLHLMHSLGPFLPGPGNSAPIRSSTLRVEVIG